MFDKKKKDRSEPDTTPNGAQPEAEKDAAEVQVDAEFADVTEQADIPDAELIEPEDKPDPLAEELAHQKELYQRLAAEYDNFRKRTVREKEALTGDIRSSCIAALLPVMDNLERALAADATSAEAMHQGVQMVLSQATAIFESLGVTAYGEPGDVFDPNLHHSVSTAKTEEYESGQITLVMQKGYLLSGKVVRPAMVQIEE